jgi:hypothetical protein
MRRSHKRSSSSSTVLTRSIMGKLLCKPTSTWKSTRYTCRPSYPDPRDFRDNQAFRYLKWYLYSAMFWSCYRTFANLLLFFFILFRFYPRFPAYELSFFECWRKE